MDSQNILKKKTWTSHNETPSAGLDEMYYMKLLKTLGQMLKDGTKIIALLKPGIVNNRPESYRPSIELMNEFLFEIIGTSHLQSKFLNIFEPNKQVLELTEVVKTKFLHS